MAVTINASTSNGLIQTADTSGTIQLQSNGTTVATAQSTGFQISTYTPATSLITSGTTVASTSGTSITFSSIPSWVKRITVMLNGVSTSGTSNYQIQIGSGSVTTTGYVGTVSQGSTNVNFSAGFLLNNPAVASTNYSGSVVLTLIASNTWIESGLLGNNAASYPVFLSAGNSASLSGALDRVVITTVNGTDTFDAGSINILYE
jgi:hypothetical protein